MQNDTKAFSVDPIRAADRLVQLVEGLHVPYGYERSLRLCQRALLPHRFLLTIHKDPIEQPDDLRIMELCRRMKMPEAFLETTAQTLAAARFVHFGFEEDEKACLYKVYLEHGAPNTRPAAAERNRRTPVLLHVAFKWDVGDPVRRAVTRYIWYPSLRMRDIANKLEEIYGDSKYERSLEIAKDILELATGRTAPEDLRYMEVTEVQNARRSFDLNLYDAELQVQDVYPFLARMCQQYSIPPERFEALFDGIKTRTLGHLAGGLHRKGEDFFNLYYGVEGRNG